MTGSYRLVVGNLTCLLGERAEGPKCTQWPQDVLELRFCSSYQFYFIFYIAFEVRILELDHNYMYYQMPGKLFCQTILNPVNHCFTNLNLKALLLGQFGAKARFCPDSYQQFQTKYKVSYFLIHYR